MRVRFTENFDYTPSSDPRILVEYKSGHELTVKREAGLAAIAAGKAQELPAPKKATVAKASPPKSARTKSAAVKAATVPAVEASTGAPTDAEA
jgi:hypothetical protein